MSLRHFTAVMLLGIGVSAFGYIAPLGMLLKEVFENRRATVATEVTLRHRVLVAVGEWLDVEEKIVRERNQIYLLWRVPSQHTSSIAGELSNHTYSMSKERSYPTRSEIFIRFLTTVSADEIRDYLIAERFATRDTFLQFRQNFVPSGDPAMWNIQENYLRHDDVYLTRTPNEGVGVTVGQIEGDSSRSVVFEPKLKGISRLEWREANQVGSWSLGGYAKMADGSWYPKFAHFDYSGTERIRSEILQVRPLKDKALYDYKVQWKQAARSIPNLSGPSDTAFKLLLSYR